MLQEIHFSESISIDLHIVVQVIRRPLLLSHGVPGIVDQKSVGTCIIAHDIVYRNDRRNPVSQGDRVPFILVPGNQYRILLEENPEVFSDPDMVFYRKCRVNPGAIPLIIGIDQRSLLVQVGQGYIIRRFFAARTGRDRVLRPAAGLKIS